MLRLHADDRVVWERELSVVKPSEMIVAEISWKKIGSARAMAFSVAPAPHGHEGEREPATEAAA